jgi:hypothetical protein
MDDKFEAVLAALKRLLLDENLPDDLAPCLTGCYNTVARAYEMSIDRRIEAAIGKEKYQQLLALEGVQEGIDNLMKAQGLFGLKPEDDLPN